MLAIFIHKTYHLKQSVKEKSIKENIVSCKNLILTHKKSFHIYQNFYIDINIIFKKL